MSRRISFIVGSLILFLVFIWILHWAQSLPPSGQILNLSRDVAIGILGSIAASCAFYSALELLLYLSDASGRAELARIKRFEEQYGISDVLLNKSGDDAIGLYQSSIKEARTRVWAMGISNNQFIDQHWDRIKIRKMENPTLEVKILFFDPESTVSWTANKAGAPLINLFDFPETIYSSDKRTSNVRQGSTKIAGDSSVNPEVHLVTLPSYFSMMIVDDRVFFFPFLAIAEDAASNPILVLSAQKNLGSRLVKHFEQLASNTLLCRKLSTPQTNAVP